MITCAGPGTDHVEIYRHPYRYSAHPCITTLPEGSWLVAFGQTARSEPFLHPPGDPRFVNVVTRSADRGRSWSEPVVVPDYGWEGVETPGIATTHSGRVILNQLQFRWYPADAALELWRNGHGPFYVTDDADGQGRHTWRLVETDEDWQRHRFPYVRSDATAFVHLSDDGARSWPRTVEIDTAPYQGAFSPKGAAHTTDGVVLLALGSHDYDPLAASVVIRSHDEGHSWSAPIEVARAPGLVFSEPKVVDAGGGRILVLSREERSGYLYQSVSTDNGLTWAPPQRLPLWGYPADAVRCRDGRLVAVFGRRRQPYSIRVAVSDDRGATWSDEFVIRGGLPTPNLGYPSLIEYAPGRLFCVYYTEDDAGVTGIEGSYFCLP